MAKRPVKKTPVEEKVMEEVTEEKPILNFEGETYVIEDLPEEAQELLATLQAIVPQLTEAQNNVKILEKARESFILDLRDILQPDDEDEEEE